jgi:hypothetical protein
MFYKLFTQLYVLFTINSNYDMHDLQLFKKIKNMQSFIEINSQLQDLHKLIEHAVKIRNIILAFAFLNGNKSGQNTFSLKDLSLILKILLAQYLVLFLNFFKPDILLQRKMFLL